MRSPRAIHDDVAGADLEDLAVELHQSPPRHDHVQLVVVVVVRVRADLRSGWDDGEVDEAAVAHVTSLEHTGRENGASPTMGDLGPNEDECAAIPDLGRGGGRRGGGR